eukprot:TRINITY_DN2249_c0_g1_i6.p1 TRINITY_DN2249_c0_g1~~TRINITY_DN2249_c0_g1_i6.p1  ORF type:complete len:261 (-),score=40.37 TRINITY_DN2249_c0_g1_i6:235-1017(-)
MENCDNTNLCNVNVHASQEQILQLQQEVDNLRLALSKSKQYIEKIEFQHKQQHDDLIRKLQDFQDQVKLEQGKNEVLEQIASAKKMQMEELINGRNKQEKQLRMKILKMEQQETLNNGINQTYEKKLSQQNDMITKVRCEMEEIKRQLQDVREMIGTVTCSLDSLETELENSLSREKKLYDKFTELQNHVVTMEQDRESQQKVIQQLEQQLKANEAKEGDSSATVLVKEVGLEKNRIKSPFVAEVDEKEFEELRDDDANH